MEKLAGDLLLGLKLVKLEILLTSFIDLLSDKLGELEHFPFAWNFRVGFLGQMERFISSGKTGSKYDAVPFVKNDPVELGRLGRLVPRFAKLSTMGERMARVKFCKWYSLSRSFRLE